MESVRLEVATPSRRYVVTIGDGVLGQLPRLLDEAGTPARRFVVSNPLVWRLHGGRLAAAGLTEPILVPDGERFKHLQTVSRVYDALIKANADRASTLVTLGGGVQYMDKVDRSTTTSNQYAPGFTLWNAMASYEVNNHFSLRLNANNLFDEEYVDRVGGGHYVPGAGRTFILTGVFTF